MQSTATALESELLPSWFTPARFLDEHFNAEAYVADLRRFVPLEALSSQLQAYLKVLKGKLVEVINEDYNDFVSLSTKLVNVDGAVVQMQKPLLILKERLTLTQEAVQTELDVLKQGLQKRQQAAKVKELLNLMQDTAHVMSKVEKLLSEVDSLGALEVTDVVPPETLDSRTRLYERVATEVSRLKYYLVKGEKLPNLQQLQPRADHAVEQLSGLLQQALSLAVKGSNQSAVMHCLQAYAVIGDTADAEQVIKDTLVEPVVQDVLKKAWDSKGPAAFSLDQLKPVLDMLTGQVQDQCSHLIEACTTAQSGLQAFDFLGNSVLAAVDQQVAEAMPGAFSPGKPASFLANYAAAMDFLNRLEAMCTTRAALQVFRSSSAFDSFLKRWKLSIYFSLRFQEIAGPVESSVLAQALTPVTEEQQADNTQQLCLQPSLALCHALQQYSPFPSAGPTRPTTTDKSILSGHEHCIFLSLVNHIHINVAGRLHRHVRTLFLWRCDDLVCTAAIPCILDSKKKRCMAEDVFLQPVADKFVRLVFQLLARYSSWLAEGLSGRASANAVTALQNGASQAQSGWAAVASPEQLALVRADLDSLCQWLRSSFQPSLQERLQFMPTQILDPVLNTFQEAISGLQLQAQPVNEAIVAVLLERCLTVLRQLRGITATYRMTARPLPTRPSHYVFGVLQPLRAFLDTAKPLQAPAQMELTQAHVSNVCQQYGSMVSELIGMLHKTEQSLARVRKNKPADVSAAAGSEMSSIQKISLQLLLDIKEFGVQIGHFGIKATDVPEYNQLVHIIESEQQTSQQQ